MDDLLLYGPPGTGKTTSGLKWLEKRVDEGADIYRAAFVSYTKAAVEEANERLGERFGVNPETELPYSRTLHSLCVKTLGLRDDWLADDKLDQFAEEYGYSLKPAKKSTPDDDLETMREKEGEDAPYLRIWDFARHRLIPDAEAGWDAFTDYDPDGAAFVRRSQFESFVEDYEKWKQENCLRDYTDLLTEYLDNPTALPVSVAVVDECQDLSPLLWSVADHLFAEAEFRATLGDDDQAVYSFSGAVPRLMNQRSTRHRVKLSQSYRLPRAITRAALSIIEQNEDREPKEIIPLDVEGVAERVSFLEDLELLNNESWFVLCRNWKLLDQILPTFEQEGIPYRIGGGRRYSPWSDKGPLRAARAILRLSAGQTLTMGELWPLVQKTGTQRGEKVGVWEWGFKKRLENRVVEMPDARLTWRDLGDLGMTRWGFERVMRRDFSVLTREVSERDLRTYQNALKRGTLEREVRISVGSMHGSKGKEADNVVALMACTGGPARAMLRPWRAEEERRVAYVAATRAKRAFYGLRVRAAGGVFPYEILGV